MPRLTGFFSVSPTQPASGSPVITGMVTPRPGSGICRASAMMALDSWVFCKISLDTLPGREIVVVRLISIDAILLLLYFMTSVNHSANCSRVEPVGVLFGSPPSRTLG